MKVEFGKYLWRKNVDEGSAGELPHRFALLVSWMVFGVSYFVFPKTHDHGQDTHRLVDRRRSCRRAD